MKFELLSLHLVNAGPIDDVTLDFSDGNGHARPITLLAGANGSGKTTVLETIFELLTVLEHLETLKPATNYLSRLEMASLAFAINGEKQQFDYGQQGRNRHYEA